MMRHCDGKDQNLIAYSPDSGKFEPCSCDTRFDDVNHSVVHPHQPIRVLTDLEREQIEEIGRQIVEGAGHDGRR